MSRLSPYAWLLAASLYPLSVQAQDQAQALDLPAAAGPYRSVVRSQHLLFFSGQVGLDQATQRVINGGVEAETHRVLQILQARLQQQGLTLRDVVSVTVYLTDMRQYEAVNRIYQQYFTREYPARTCVGVTALPAGAHIEITLTAAFAS